MVDTGTQHFATDLVSAANDRGEIMNKIRLRGKWRQARGSMKAEWGRLTENEQRVVEGRLDQLLGLFQERYGYTRERAAKALEGYLHTHARKPVGTVSMPSRDRSLVLATVGLVFMSAIGWVLFFKMIGEKPPLLERTAPDATDAFEPEDFEAVMMGYDGALE